MLLILILIQNYIWPTDATELLTSSFSEPRINRYHTGIDIRTYNKEGFKCFAIDDGYILRIKTSVYGYGKVVYYKTDSGHIAVYAHLSQFNRTLNDVVKSVQKKRGKYRVDLYFKKNQYRYKKGNIIAYTGSSGVGTPHLHFEIRESMEKTLNPLDFYPDFKDKYRPEVREMAAVALTKSTIVNGAQTYSFMQSTKLTDSTYVIEEPIKLTGSMGLTFRAFDRTRQWQLPNGIEYAELFLNDSLIFKTEHDQIEFKYNRNSNFDTNLFLRKNHNDKFKNLFYPTQVRTSKTNVYEKQGIINSEDLPQRVNTFEAIFYDHKQNKSSIKGQIIQRDAQLIRLEYNREFKNNNAKFPYLFNSFFIYPNNGIRLNHDQSPSFSTTIWTPSKRNRIENDVITIDVPAGAVYQNESVYLIDMDESYFPANTENVHAFHFLPNHLKTKKSFVIKSKQPLKDKENFYEWNVSKKRWDFMSSRKDDTSRSYFSTTSMNVYAIIKDESAPIIYNRVRKSSKGDLLISVYDELSGIYNERNFEIYQGKRRVVGEYDFETKKIKIDRYFLGKGNTLRITLRDNAGNSVTKTLSFNE